jgi:2-phospho-L-lactate transferase/gluconeogenesis factor (CofD/UPF0052 family)
LKRKPYHNLNLPTIKPQENAMSALSAIHDYLKTHFAGHDTATLMQNFEAAIEAKVEAGLADVKQEIADLKAQIVPAKPDPVATTVTTTETAK